eukprot:2224051-Alexandrium_andersonii.AAC.1
MPPFLLLRCSEPGGRVEAGIRGSSGLTQVLARNQVREPGHLDCEVGEPERLRTYQSPTPDCAK